MYSCSSFFLNLVVSGVLSSGSSLFLSLVSYLFRSLCRCLVLDLFIWFVRYFFIALSLLISHVIYIYILR